MIDSRQKIEEYLIPLSNSEPESLKELRAKTESFGVAARMNVGHYLGTFLEMLTKSTQTSKILEIGTFTGYSTLCFARGLPHGGKITTVDKDASSNKVAQEVARNHGLDSKIEFVLGDALEVMKSLSGPYDLVFIDADKTRYPLYWEESLRLLRPGGILLADNILRDGGAMNPADKGDHAIRDFNETASKDPRVDRVFLPIRDGILYAIKR